MPKYTLTYFPIRGRAEELRLIFAAAGQEYEDKRIQMYTETDVQKAWNSKTEDLVPTEEWLDIKEKAPFGQLPILEVDGKIIAQTKVIGNYLGRQFGLSGSTQEDRIKGAMIIEATREIFGEKSMMIRNIKDEAEKAEAIKKYTTEELPNMLARLEKLAGSNGHFVGEKLTVADIKFFNACTAPAIKKIDVDLLKCPNLQKVCSNVTSNPGIEKWLKERPDTMF